ncbi:MAG: chalcone isomerase family protein [Desulfobacterales bacterium]
MKKKMFSGLKNSAAAVFTAVLALVFTVSSAGAAEVGDETLPDEVRVEGEELVLNGAGIREKFYLDVYAAGLYLRQPEKDHEKIMAADETMALKIRILSSMIGSKKFKEAALEGFEEATDGNTDPIQDEIDLFLSAFSGEIEKGDEFDIHYIRGEGTKVYKNQRDDPEVVVPGMPVKQALFGIWISNRSEENLQKLRKELLGL